MIGAERPVQKGSSSYKGRLRGEHIFVINRGGSSFVGASRSSGLCQTELLILQVYQMLSRPCLKLVLQFILQQTIGVPDTSRHLTSGQRLEVKGYVMLND